jgi:hypothetical protein
LKPPARFLAKAAAFGAICLAGIFALGRVKAKAAAASDYMAVIVDKHARLAAIPAPRILLGGGSNLVFGVDSAAIERALQIPVVNMSVHAALGLRFILSEMKDVMRPHDVVVLSIEYQLPLAPGQYALAKSASDAYPPALAYYQRDLQSDLSVLVANQQKLVRALFSRTAPADLVYARAAFTERGDDIAHLTAPRPATLRDRGRLEAGRWEGVAALNDFADAARRQNVRVFFVYPSYPDSEYAKNRDLIAAIDRDLRENVRIELLGTPRDFVYPDDEFFDTVYHLAGPGRRQRTDELIRLLQAKLPPTAVTVR